MLFGANVAYQGVTVNGDGLLVSGSYFPVLGLKPALGRLVAPDDDTPIGQHFYTVLSYGFWSSQIGRDPSVLGKTMLINGRTMTVIGVAPRGFEGTTVGTQPKVFVPMSMRHEMEIPFGDEFTDRRSYRASSLRAPQARRHPWHRPRRRSTPRIPPS